MSREGWDGPKPAPWGQVRLTAAFATSLCAGNTVWHVGVSVWVSGWGRGAPARPRAARDTAGLGAGGMLRGCSGDSRGLGDVRGTLGAQRMLRGHSGLGGCQHPSCPGTRTPKDGAGLGVHLPPLQHPFLPFSFFSPLFLPFLTSQSNRGRQIRAARANYSSLFPGFLDPLLLRRRGGGGYQGKKPRWETKPRVGASQGATTTSFPPWGCCWGG